MEINLNIRPIDLETLQNLLKQYLPGITVWAFGSRVKFTNTISSDLDLVAFISKEESLKLSFLADAIEEAFLPFRIDLLSWYEIPDNFKKNIQRNYVVIQSEEKQKLPMDI
jgi:predicted nucleotidyltransferase